MESFLSYAIIAVGLLNVIVGGESQISVNNEIRRCTQKLRALSLASLSVSLRIAYLWLKQDVTLLTPEFAAFIILAVLWAQYFVYGPVRPEDLTDKQELPSSMTAEQEQSELELTEV